MYLQGRLQMAPSNPQASPTYIEGRQLSVTDQASHRGEMHLEPHCHLAHDEHHIVNAHLFKGYWTKTTCGMEPFLLPTDLLTFVLADGPHQHAAQLALGLPLERWRNAVRLLSEGVLPWRWRDSAIHRVAGVTGA
jgi:hypothetical protein